MKRVSCSVAFFVLVSGTSLAPIAYAVPELAFEDSVGICVNSLSKDKVAGLLTPDHLRQTCEGLVQGNDIDIYRDEPDIRKQCSESLKTSGSPADKAALDRCVEAGVSSAYASADTILRQFNTVVSVPVAVETRLGSFFAKNRDYPRAIQHYERALSLQREEGDKSSSSGDALIAQFEVYIGTLRLEQKQYTKAREGFQSAIKSFESNPDNKGDVSVAWLHAGLGRAEVHLNNDAKGVESLKKAVDIIEESGKVANDKGVREVHWRVAAEAAKG